ncbi:hypothetical protein E1536_22695 [Salmonella enterica subsp. enterica serovar Arechavaleta]|nr:hypothetical protein [Salmonella enterica subsp. enterica serovar Arechavaleta]
MNWSVHQHHATFSPLPNHLCSCPTVQASKLCLGWL